VVSGNVDVIIPRTEEALESNISASTILDQSLIPAMDLVGEKMEKGEVFIPEVLFYDITQYKK